MHAPVKRRRKKSARHVTALDGNSTVADYPKIGGQYPDYLAKALRDYKSGARKNPIMAGFAGTLSKQDIDNVVGVLRVATADGPHQALSSKDSPSAA